MIRDINDPTQTINVTSEFFGMIRDLNLDEDAELRRFVDVVGLKRFIEKVGRKRLLDELLQDLTPEQREELKHRLS